MSKRNTLHKRGKCGSQKSRKRKSLTKLLVFRLYINMIIKDILGVSWDFFPFFSKSKKEIF